MKILSMLILLLSFFSIGFTQELDPAEDIQRFDGQTWQDWRIDNINTEISKSELWSTWRNSYSEGFSLIQYGQFWATYNYKEAPGGRGAYNDNIYGGVFQHYAAVRLRQWVGGQNKVMGIIGAVELDPNFGLTSMTDSFQNQNGSAGYRTDLKGLIEIKHLNGWIYLMPDLKLTVGLFDPDLNKYIINDDVAGTKLTYSHLNKNLLSGELSFSYLPFIEGSLSRDGDDMHVFNFNYKLEDQRSQVTFIPSYTMHYHPKGETPKDPSFGNLEDRDTYRHIIGLQLLGDWDPKDELNIKLELNGVFGTGTPGPDGYHDPNNTGNTSVMPGFDPDFENLRYQSWATKVQFITSYKGFRIALTGIAVSGDNPDTDVRENFRPFSHTVGWGSDLPGHFFGGETVLHSGGAEGVDVALDAKGVVAVALSLGYEVQTGVLKGLFPRIIIGYSAPLQPNAGTLTGQFAPTDFELGNYLADYGFETTIPVIWNFTDRYALAFEYGLLLPTVALNKAMVHYVGTMFTISW